MYDKAQTFPVRDAGRWIFSGGLGFQFQGDKVSPEFQAAWGGFLEKSNVDVVKEMVGMISAQRAYEINSRVIQGVDEMLETAGGLLR